MTKIYTRGGDQGQTFLGNGARLSKSSDRIQAMGHVDEANAALGLVRLHLEIKQATSMILRLQNDLFDLVADPCVPDDRGRQDVLWQPGTNVRYD